MSSQSPIKICIFTMNYFIFPISSIMQLRKGRLQNYKSFSDINNYYFMGEKFNPEEFTEGITLWNKQENSFISRYIETMLQEADIENQNLIIDLDNKIHKHIRHKTPPSWVAFLQIRKKISQTYRIKSLFFSHLFLELFILLSRFIISQSYLIILRHVFHFP